MAYRKSVVGEHNQANETASHNRIQIETGASLTIIAVYIITLVTGSLIFIAVAFGEYLKDAIVVTIASLFIAGWIWLIMFVRRGVSKTETVLLLDKMARSRAQLEANIAVTMENYAIYKDENGILQFRGTTQITENRHYPAMIEAPPPDHRETILELFDKGISGRSIEKMLKEKKVSYREISKTLDLYRPDWSKSTKRIVESDYVDADE